MKRRKFSHTWCTLRLLLVFAGLAGMLNSNAQELSVKININSSQIEGSDKSVFENLQQTLEQWLNDRQWTELQFQQNERSNCNFNITVTKHDPSENLFTCNALIQANRPVFNSSYTNYITFAI